MEQVGAAAMPVMVGLILLFGFCKGLNVFDSFLAGAKEGIHTSFGILPTLVGLIVAVSMVRASGLLELISGLGRPVAELAGVSPELLPLALLRPISGSGATAYLAELLEKVGPDSVTGKAASVLAASTETTFYAVTVYFGACRCRRTGWSIPAALTGDVVATVLAVATVTLFG